MSNKAFENWAIEQTYAVRQGGELMWNYPCGFMAAEAWQAARTAALEQAAEACDIIGPALADRYGPGSECLVTADECAEYIRALKDA